MTKEMLIIKRLISRGDFQQIICMITFTAQGAFTILVGNTGKLNASIDFISVYTVYLKNKKIPFQIFDMSVVRMRIKLTVE